MLLNKLNLVVGKRVSGKSTWIISQLENMHKTTNLSKYTIIVITHPIFSNSSVYKNLFASIEFESKSKPKIQICELIYFLIYVFPYLKSNINYIIILEDGYEHVDLESKYAEEYDCKKKYSKFINGIILKLSSVQNITVIQESQQIKSLFDTLFLTKEKNNMILKEIKNILHQKYNLDMANLLENIGEYKFVNVLK